MSSNTQQAIGALLALPMSKVKLGLERIEKALQLLGHPERSYPCIHVGGSNGKGSVCAMLASCLSAGGLRAGLYTSPHLSHLNERFQINQKPLADELLAEGILELQKLLKRKLELTFFEFGTALAFWLFAKQKVDIAIIEVGLGGRLDATNVLLPCLSAITSIALEHTQWLGNSVDAIALEKAHIFKPGIPALVSAQALEAAPVLLQHAQSIGAPLWAEGGDFSMQAQNSGGWCWKGFGRQVDNIQLALRGPHQLGNAALALACLELSPFRLEAAALRRGLQETHWPGRLEYFEGTPPVLLDGAHNPAGIEALTLALEQLWPTAELHLVFSVLEDKALEPMAALLFPRCTRIYLAPLNHVRARPPQAYLPLAQRFCQNSFACHSTEEALQKAFESSTENALVVVAGSLYLVGKAREQLLGMRPCCAGEPNKNKP